MTKRTLVYKATGRPVAPGDVVKVLDRGPAGDGTVDARIESIIEPRTPESTGRVVLRIGGEESHPYYPSVIGAEWR